MDLYMRTPVLWFLGCVALLFVLMVSYAVSRGRNVKASMKILWAAFSFEANEPHMNGDDRLKRPPGIGRP
jgi:hypothetical protein